MDNIDWHILVCSVLGIIGFLALTVKVVVDDQELE